MTFPLLESWLAASFSEDDDRASGRLDRAQQHHRMLSSVPHETGSHILGLSDAEVVARVRAGDQAVYSALWRAYWIPLTQLAFFQLHDRDAAEDLVAEVLSDVWRRRESWEVRGSVTAYLFVAVRHRALNAMRSDRRRQSAYHRALPSLERLPAIETEHALDNAIDAPALRARVALAVQSLPERARTILLLRWRFQESWADVAEVLGVSVSAAKVQHHRALGLLRERLGLEPDR